MGESQPGRVRCQEGIHALLITCISDGDDFKILGVRFDSRLTLANAINELVREMRWRIRAIMWSRQHPEWRCQLHGALFQHARWQSIWSCRAIRRQILKDVGGFLF